MLSLAHSFVEEALGIRPGRVLADAVDADQVVSVGREEGRVRLVHVCRQPMSAKRCPDLLVLRVVVDWLSWTGDGVADVNVLVGLTVMWMLSCVMDVVYVCVLCR